MSVLGLCYAFFASIRMNSEYCQIANISLLTKGFVSITLGFASDLVTEKPLV